MDAASASIPDGIDQSSLGDGGAIRRHATGLVLLLLLLLLGSAFAGVWAGKPNPIIALRTDAGFFEVNAPKRIRSGQLFEVRMRGTAKKDIADLVVAVPPSLWRDWTVNTMIPAPTEESFSDGRFNFHFGELKAGTSFELKVDAQLNPALFGSTRGDVVLMDGETWLGSLPLATRVLP